MGKNYIDIRVYNRGLDDNFKNFIELLAKIQYLGSVGCSRTIPLYIDGDGAARFEFEEIINKDKTLKMGIGKLIEINDKFDYIQNDSEPNRFNDIYFSIRKYMEEETSEKDNELKTHLIIE